jgi:hypothetical protein
MNHTYALWGALILATAHIHPTSCTPSAQHLVSPTQHPQTLHQKHSWESYIRPVMRIFMAGGLATALYQNRDIVAEILEAAVAHKATTLAILVALITTLE